MMRKMEEMKEMVVVGMTVNMKHCSWRIYSQAVAEWLPPTMLVQQKLQAREKGRPQ
jgi:hypothetical protein